MARISATQVLIYLLALGIVLLLVGLMGAKGVRSRHSDNPYPVENFDSPDVSSENAVEGGASQLYGWGYTPIAEEETRRTRRTVQRHCPHCENVYVDKTDIFVVPPTDSYCRNCDITKNKDIDKYVLKSSVPPCPDMNEYARKNELPPWFNPDDWVRKSDIPPCATPNMRDYILKSEIPSCPLPKDCPKCPECPTCPKCPPCPPERVRVVEKIKYSRPERPFGRPMHLPQAYGDFFPQVGGPWRPRVSNTVDGFINPKTPLAGSLPIARGADEQL
jgi:hypothetical protein